MAVTLFCPSARTLYVTATTTASSATALPALAEGQTCSIFVAGTSDVGIAFGGVSVEATAAGTDRSPLYIARCKEGITIPHGATHISVIATSGTSDVQFVLGSGG